MFEIYTDNHTLWIGSGTDCCPGNEGMAVVHANKSPCHQRALKYKGSLPSIHPNYLYLRNDLDLFLNMIDPPTPLFKVKTFTVTMAFLKEQLSERDVLVHCNNGRSRAPSLVLVYMSKYGLNTEHPITDAQMAIGAFPNYYPDYEPGAGIQTFLAEHWEEL